MKLRNLSALLLLAASLAHAQPYRWTDDKGRVHFSDTPPASAKAAKSAPQRESSPSASAPASASAAAEQPVPFAIKNVQKDFPVSLYTSPICKMPCEQAREVLNRRGIPFTEVQVWDAEGLEKLKTLANSDKVPTILVGHSSIVGLDPGRYDSLLDSAGYPRLGAFPPRAQKAPAPPAGYEPPPVAEAVKSEQGLSARPQKSGPYDSSGLQDPSARPQKAGQYDPSGLQGPPAKPGGYKLPDSPG